MRAHKRPRSFRRDACLGIRMPAEVKEDLQKLAKQKLRDASSLGLEAICRFITSEQATSRPTVISQ